MARNFIQFQPALSLLAFFDLYGSETQSLEEALLKPCCKKGFVCSACDNTTVCLPSRCVYQCHRFNHQALLTVNTIFYSTHLLLTTRFLAMYLLTQRKNFRSALQLSRGVGRQLQHTARKIKYKILQIMLEPNQGEGLSVRIKFNDASLGGERSGKYSTVAAQLIKFPC